MFCVKFFIIVFFATSFIAISGDDFYLLDSCKNSNINYKALRNIDTFSKSVFMTDVFNCVKGTSKIYRFIRTRKIGTEIPISSLYDPISIPADSLFREIIVLKVVNGFIVESYYCHLNFMEGPWSFSTLRSRKRIKFSDNIDIRKLNLNWEINGGKSDFIETRQPGILRMRE